MWWGGLFSGAPFMNYAMLQSIINWLLNIKPMRRIDHIVIHCSATMEGQDWDVTDIDRWHKARGWRNCGYHYVIKLDGTIQQGRKESEIGAHVQGHNKYSIGICYIGGLGKDKAPKDTRTWQQKKALLKLLTELKLKYPESVILGHRDFSPDKNGNGIIEPFEWMKACPCFDAIIEYSDLQ